MRLLLCLAFLAIATPSLQLANNSTTNSTSEITVTAAPTEKPLPPSPPSPPSPPPSPSTLLPLNCPPRCARVYRPVCAWVAGKRHTYANRCMMRSDIGCARRNGVADLYRISFIRQGHCNAKKRRRRRRRPLKGGGKPKRRKPNSGGLSRVL